MKNKTNSIDNLTFAEHPFATDLTAGIWGVITTVDERLMRLKTMSSGKLFQVLRLPHLQTTVRKAAEARLKRLKKFNTTSHTNPATPAAFHFPFPVVSEGSDADTTTLHEAFEATTWTHPAVINSQLTQLNILNAIAPLRSLPSQLTTGIAWIDATVEFPDDDTTVLIANPAWDEPVCLGYHSGGEWCDQADLFWAPGDVGEPTHWAHLPEAPDA